MHAENSPLPNLPVECRANGGAWFIAVFSGILGMGSWYGAYDFLYSPMLAHRDSGGAMMFIFGGLCFTLPAAIFAYWAFRAHIIATEDGLRWRGLRGWKSAAWDDVQDYYMLDSRKEQRTYTVETASGKLNISTFHSGAEPMARVISSRALKAPISIWEQLGCRSGDVPPCRFHYSVPIIWGSIALFISPGLLLLFLTKPNPVADFQLNAQSIGLEWAIGSAVLLFVVLGLFLSIYGLLIATAWNSLRRACCWIETSVDGIVFVDGKRQVEARWDQVREYGASARAIKALGMNPFHVVTDAGAFSFNQYMMNYLLLLRIIRHWAPHAQNTQIPHAQMEAVGGEALLQIGGVPEVSVRIHHYRTRTNRALLWCPTVIILLTPALILLGQWAQTPSTPAPRSPYVAVSALILTTLWGWWRFYSARIEIDETGILERSVFGARRQDWTEITSITSGEFLTTLSGGDKKVRYWCTIAHFEELNAEIERRAVNCVNKNWTTEEQKRR